MHCRLYCLLLLGTVYPFFACSISSSKSSVTFHSSHSLSCIIIPRLKLLLQLCSLNDHFILYSQILKLSYNKLREIPSSLTFSGLTSLLRLYLDHNILQHIHPRALLQLPSLRLLRLQGNKLHQLHPHTLCTLSLLNTYYFSTLRWALTTLSHWHGCCHTLRSL